MSVALVTGCGGLIGTEACEQYAGLGYDVIGIDNDQRAVFFGAEASTAHNVQRLNRTLGRGFTHLSIDIRDRDAIDKLFNSYRPDVVIHTAAQPSHDWAARDPHTDFGVNAVGTLNLLQAARTFTPDSPFAHISTSKVYGDRPNSLPLERHDDRLDLPTDHEYYEGITTTMSVDNCLHSLFGASKLSGDLLAQEYGRYFDMPVGIFRPGCLTGGEHKGVPLHGFLSYLGRAVVEGLRYQIIGYDGLQVRCNIHATDTVNMLRTYCDNPSGCGKVYNIGGGRENACSMLEAVAMFERAAGRSLDMEYVDTPRIGDHRWWVSSNAAFEQDYPDWTLTRSLPSIVEEIVDSWAFAAAA